MTRTAVGVELITDWCKVLCGRSRKSNARCVICKPSASCSAPRTPSVCSFYEQPWSILRFLRSRQWRLYPRQLTQAIQVAAQRPSLACHCPSVQIAGSSSRNASTHVDGLQGLAPAPAATCACQLQSAIGIKARSQLGCSDAFDRVLALTHPSPAWCRWSSRIRGDRCR